MDDCIGFCFAYPVTTPNCAGVDIPWLPEVPVRSMVGADSSFNFYLFFDSIKYTIGTTVNAALSVRIADNTFHIPIVMNVVPKMTFLPLIKKP
jgi:hypothetical protein